MPINCWASSKRKSGENAEIRMLPLQELLQFLPGGWASVVPRGRQVVICCMWWGQPKGWASSPEKVKTKKNTAHIDEIVFAKI